MIGYLFIVLWVIAVALMPEIAMTAAIFAAWGTACWFFGGHAVGALGLAVALTVALAGWSQNFMRWMHRRRSPLLVGKRRTHTAGARG